MLRFRVYSSKFWSWGPTLMVLVLGFRFQVLVSYNQGLWLRGLHVGLHVQGLGFRVWSLEIRCGAHRDYMQRTLCLIALSVQSLGFRILGLVIRDQGLRSMVSIVQGLVFQDLGLRILDLGFKAQGLPFRVQVVICRVQGILTSRGVGHVLLCYVFRIQGLGFWV